MKRTGILASIALVMCACEGGITGGDDAPATPDTVIHGEVDGAQAADSTDAAAPDVAVVDAVMTTDASADAHDSAVVDAAPADSGCGAVGQPCCDAFPSCSSEGTSCQAHRCEPCGGDRQVACTSGAPCAPGTTLVESSCYACGGSGQPCCGGWCHSVDGGAYVCEGTCGDAGACGGSTTGFCP